MRTKQKGITLIALVITIIVLLILAGITIAMLTGQNGVLTQANNAKIAQAHGNVKDSMALAYNEYQLEKQTQNVGEIEKVASTSKVEIKGKEKNYLARLDTFLDFLLDKGYIENKETGKIVADKLTGAHQVIGNGGGETDIYKIEGTEGTYIVNYYNQEGIPTLIWNARKNDENISSRDLDYFIVCNTDKDSLGHECFYIEIADRSDEWLDAEHIEYYYNGNKLGEGIRYGEEAFFYGQYKIEGNGEYILKWESNGKQYKSIINISKEIFMIDYAPNVDYIGVYDFENQECLEINNINVEGENFEYQSSEIYNLKTILIDENHFTSGVTYDTSVTTTEGNLVSGKIYIREWVS